MGGSIFEGCRRIMWSMMASVGGVLKNSKFSGRGPHSWRNMAGSVLQIAVDRECTRERIDRKWYAVCYVKRKGRIRAGMDVEVGKEGRGK